MTTEPLLLDTCAVIWTAIDAPMRPEAEGALNASAQDGIDVMVSPISAWELGMLAARRRLPATQDPAELFDELIGRPGIALERLTTGVLIDSSFLPGDFHNDPADRIIVATARAFNLTIVTRDEAILAYSRQGYVRALKC